MSSHNSHKSFPLEAVSKALRNQIIRFYQLYISAFQRHSYCERLCVTVLLLKSQFQYMNSRFLCSVTCTDGARRRLILSSSFMSVKITPLHCQIPLIGVKLGAWMNFAIHVSGLVEGCFSGVKLRSTDTLAIGGVCKVTELLIRRQNCMSSLDNSFLQ